MSLFAYNDTQQNDTEHNNTQHNSVEFLYAV